MSDKMNDLFDNVKKMVDSGNIPSDIQQMMNNFQNSSNNANTSNNQNSYNGQNANSSAPDLSNILSQVSPEMLSNLSNMMNSNSQSNSNINGNNNNSGFNIDANTIMKMQSIMSQMNNKNDPRANLLHSLKPYLRDTKKGKLDQYVNLLNISKIADVMNKNNNKENNENA